MKEMVYCEWHDKELKDVAEYEQEQCSKYEMYCSNCQYLTDKIVVEAGERGETD